MQNVNKPCAKIPGALILCAVPAVVLSFLLAVACSLFAPLPRQNASSASPSKAPPSEALPSEAPPSETLPSEMPPLDATPSEAVSGPTAVPSQPQGYEIGTPTLLELYISPTGSDEAGNPGTEPAQPLRTLSEAWARLPLTTTTTGYRLNLLPGAYPCEPGPEDSNCINYFSDRSGSYPFPIILRALNGPGTATIRGGLNLNHVQYLYLLDLNLVGGTPLPTNSSGNNLLHIEAGDHVLLRGLSVLGPDCATDACNNLQEVLKVNQTQHLYVENSVIGGAWHSVVDYFVVQYGHFLHNQIHTAGQWCMYVKGGTAYLTIDSNELHDCQLGFQSGQSANLAVMLPPWFHYETYDIKFTNNLLHDIPGVGLSAAGAYNTLFAYNTLYRVGTSQTSGYPLAQFVHGERNCTPIDEIPNVILNCPAFTAQGAWGPDAQSDSLPAIPNRSVYVYNNLFYNPAPEQTLYSHLDVYGPLTPPAGFQNISTPARADDNLVIAGNLIWNGPVGHPLGIEEPDRGCQPDNPTCSATQISANNTINQVEPQLVNPAGGNYRPAPGGNVFAVTTYNIPSFTWDSFTPSVPAGSLENAVPVDRDGAPRPDTGPPGAYAAALINQVYLPLVMN